MALPLDTTGLKRCWFRGLQAKTSWGSDQLVCGCAASRAESLWLSVKLATFWAATPPEASLSFLSGERKAEAFRTEDGAARKPREQPNPKSELIDESNSTKNNRRIFRIGKR